MIQLSSLIWKTNVEWVECSQHPIFYMSVCDHWKFLEVVDHSTQSLILEYWERIIKWHIFEYIKSNKLQNRIMEEFTIYGKTTQNTIELISWPQHFMRKLLAAIHSIHYCRSKFPFRNESLLESYCHRLKVSTSL